jgi:hypothetical protein
VTSVVELVLVIVVVLMGVVVVEMVFGELVTVLRVGTVTFTISEVKAVLEEFVARAKLDSDEFVDSVVPVSEGSCPPAFLAAKSFTK